MDTPSSVPGSPTPGEPLNPITPDRANTNSNTPRESSFVASLRNELRDSPVHDKISHFNTMSSQSKSLERKTADAALKRAMLGREEAESEMRRYREENKVLRVQLDKAKDREQRVSERLETVMEQYGRAKETYAHTKAAWEKEIKHARKKTFKNDAAIIKLQEELKTARDGWRVASDKIDDERARNKAREQEAFEARYQMVELEEKLGDSLERVKVLEQERDAFKTLAKEEEVARIAAEGRIPLPKMGQAAGQGKRKSQAQGFDSGDNDGDSTSGSDNDDEFASPRKKQRTSLTTAAVTSSAAAEEEIEDLERQVQWERQQAKRAYEMVDFMHAECELKSCEASQFLKRQNILSPRRVLVAPQEITNPGDLAILGQAPRPDSSHSGTSQMQTQTQARPSPRPSSQDEVAVLKKPARPSLTRKSRSGEPRRSTLFCPREGIFRTVSQEEAEAMAAQEGQQLQEVQQQEDIQEEEGDPVEAPAPADDNAQPESEHDVDEVEVEEVEDVEDIESENEAQALPEPEPRLYARTPSADPPTFALLAQERMSLASLLNAPQTDSRNAAHHTGPSEPNILMDNIPTMPDTETKPSSGYMSYHNSRHDDDDEDIENRPPPTSHLRHSTSRQQRPNSAMEDQENHYSSMHTKTTTTTVPVRDENDQRSSWSSHSRSRARTPSVGPDEGNESGQRSFDLNNPAMTPTISREEALARIRERRGRARSAAQGALTPRKQMVEGAGERRDMSAPTTTGGTGGSAAGRARTATGSQKSASAPTPASAKRAASRVRKVR